MQCSTSLSKPSYIVPHKVVSMFLNYGRLGDHFLGKTVQMPNHTLDEEPFPNIQLKSPLKQLHVLPSGPKIDHQREKISVCIPISPDEATVD